MDLKTDIIQNEFYSFMYLYDSGYYKDTINDIENKFNYIKNYSQKDSGKIFSQNQVYKKNSKNKNKEKNPIIYVKNNSFFKIKERLDKMCFTNNLDEDTYYKYKSLFLGQYLMAFFEKSNQNDIKTILDIFPLIPHNNETIMNLVKIFINFLIIPSNNLNDKNITLKEMKKLIEFLKPNEEYLNIPFCNFITQIIVSAIESNEKKNLNDIFKNIENFRIFIFNNKNILYPLVKNLIPYIQPFEYLIQINLIMGTINDLNMKKIQLKYAYMIPPLLTKEIIPLLQIHPIINKYIFSNLDIHKFIKMYLSNKKIDPQLLDIIIEINEEIIDNELLCYDEKIYLFQMLDKMIKSNVSPIQELCNNLQSFVKLSTSFIIKRDLGTFKKTIEENNYIFTNILFELNSYNTYKLFNFNNYENNLEIILNNIESLSENEKNDLKEFSLLLKKHYIDLEMVKNFEKKGKEYGLEFRNKPTIDNSAKLMAIIMKAVEETMKMSPYLIQCISIETFLFHFINSNQRKDKKGRLAQIKTGEGKSLIIAMLSLANALMGFFVDVITSTKYLAKRDQIKFKKLFDLFGISSNNITKVRLSKDDYDGIILYGTNTDFEFSLLRENIFIQNKIYTKPLNSNIKKKDNMK